MTHPSHRRSIARLVVVGFCAAFVVEGCGSDGARPSDEVHDAGTGGITAIDGGNGGANANGGSGKSDTGGGGTGGARLDGGKRPACTPGVTQCVGGSALEVCTPNGDFIAVSCGAGAHCSGGDGAAARCEGLNLCTPGEKRCATDQAAKVCDADGTAWVVQACASDELCTKGECKLDVAGGACSPGMGRCVDSKTKLRCLPDGHGFDSTDCPDSAPCQSGECVGPVCVVGATSCSQTGVRTCVDGTHFTESPCSNRSGCQTNTVNGTTTARCGASAVCDFTGQRACGDPTDPSVSKVTSYSECTGKSDGTVGWSRTDCTAPATCSPTIVGCSSQCTPGEQRCSGTVGFQLCSADGTWGAVQPCNKGSVTGQACRAKLSGELPVAECVDEACAGVSLPGNREAGPPNPGTGETSEGVCDGAKIRRCTPAGKLQPAEACTAGTCRVQGSAAVGGFHPGSCSNNCTSGESRCVADGQPLFVTCGADGNFGSAYQSCNSVCQTGVDAMQHRVALCGDSCIPGATRCSGPKRQTCGDNGKWLAAATCTVGTCLQDSGQAICHADCVPGETLCVGATKTASDGIGVGTTGSVVCAPNGTIPATKTACTGTATCRTSQAGVVTGCVECIGSAVSGGNDNGLVDSRCTADGKGVEVCGADNDYAAAASCGTGTCFVGRSRACGVCQNFGINDTCSESKIRSQSGNNFGCEQIGLGVPSACGSTPDCCTNSCESSVGAFAFCAPKGFSACLGNSSVTELSTTLPQTISGSTLFSDDTLTPSCGSGRSSPDDAYLFVAPKSGTFVFDTFGSATDTVLYAIDALGCGELQCSDDAPGTTASRIFVPLVAGQRIVVMAEATGSYTLHVTTTSITGCGNDLVDGKEVCDGSDLNGQTCASVTFGAHPNGALVCAPGCAAFDLSGCTGGSDGGGSGGGPGTFPGGPL